MAGRARDRAIDDERLAELKAALQKTMRLEWMKPQEIAPNDLNWKKHPTKQRRALRAMMDELEERRRGMGVEAATGWVGAMLYNERTGRLLDGHMRLIEALERGDELVPVLVIDVDEPTENMILAFLDRIGTLFTADDKLSEALAGMLDTENDTLRALLNMADEDDEEGDVEDEKGVERKSMPAGGLALPLGAKYDYVVLLFRREVDFNAAQDHFGLQRQQCPFTSSVGLGRVIDGGQYLYRIRKELAEAANPSLIEEVSAESILEAEANVSVSD